MLSGVNHHVFHTLEKAGLVEMIGRQNIRDHINGALSRAAELVGEEPEKHHHVRTNGVVEATEGVKNQ